MRILLWSLLAAPLFQDKPLPLEDLVVLDQSRCELAAPASVAFDEKAEEIFIADPEANAVLVLTRGGRQKAKLTIPSPASIALDRQGRLCVASSRGTIALYDFRGRKERDIAVTGLPDGTKPVFARQVVVDDKGNLYVGDAANQAIHALSWEGKVLKTYGTMGAKATIQALSAFCVAKTRVYAIDGGRSTVSVFGRSSAELLVTFGERGGTRGQLAVPVSICADAAGRVYILDSIRHCITIFDEEGAFLGESGGEGKGPGWFYFPKAIFRDAQDRFYVCETTLKRVQIFTIPVQKLRKEEKKK